MNQNENVLFFNFYLTKIVDVIKKQNNNFVVNIIKIRFFV